MDGNLNPSARTSVLAAINPQSAGAGTYTSGWVDIQKFYSIMAILAVGALGAAGTVDAKIEQATTGGGAGVKDVTGSSVAQLTKVGTDDNKQVLINLQQADLDKNSGYRFVRLSVTVGTAASLVAATLIGLDPRYGAATANDAATVDEIVS